MATSFENLAASVCFRTVGAPGVRSGVFVVNCAPIQAGLRTSLRGEGRRSSRVAILASAASSSHRLEPRIPNPKDALGPILNSEEEEDSCENEDEPTAEPAPWMSEEEARTVVSEVILDGDELRVVEYPANDEAQPDANPVNSMADSFLNTFNKDGRGFSLTEVGGILKTGEDAGEVKVPDLSVSGFDVKDGVSPLAQWTSTELTMQHSQLARIATDVRYLQNAFAFFGAVRVVEALVSVFSASPEPDFGKLKELLNALDPFTIAWLAHNLRVPIEGIVNVDPLDLEKVITLKSNLWEELHKFYERQWKVVSENSKPKKTSHSSRKMLSTCVDFLT